MEKSFNDQELADIMNEIENLEKEFATEGSSSSTTTVSETTEVLSDLVKEDLGKVLPQAKINNIIPIKTNTTSKTSSPSTSMNFKVEGDMNIELSFQVDGETLSLSVGSEGLVIHLQGGATFNLPIKTTSQATKKSA